MLRAYLPSHFAYTQRLCATGSEAWVPRLDPCDWSGDPLTPSPPLHAAQL